MTEDLFRRENARLVSLLCAQLGVHRLELAEDAVQEAFIRALQTWPYRGIPANPAAWLAQTARNLALDQLRREQNWERKQEGIGEARALWMSGEAADASTAASLEEGLGDESLRLLFVCCHPALSPEAQTALALRTLCGFSPAEIAAAFLTTEAAVAKRLVRARQCIRDLALPFAVPGPEEMPERLDAVLGTLYLLFNEGYRASSGDRLIREDLCQEAIRLALQLAAHPATRRPRTLALVALLLLSAARLPARVDDAGNPLRLREQDRSRWNAGMIARGIEYLGLAATGDELSQYHLEAGIAACHATAPDEDSTDWPRILSLYDQLVGRYPSPVVALNRAVAVARVRGPAAGLEELQGGALAGALEGYLFYHAVRGTLAAEAGRTAEALQHLRRASDLATLPGEQEFLARRIAELPAG
ncbi:MAG: sigma-70 family RNA polymerase sigma factor [Verrucomicrobiae bacterium]|nr:sigma-70 family RNA polymerase sigma factor [Verrucomicrobiae bacterium]